MEEEGAIDMTDDINKFYVSWVAIKVISPAVRKFVRPWNSHRIPGRNGGIPTVLARTSDRATRIQPPSIPSVDYAIALNKNMGGRLSAESVYGVDAIDNYSGLRTLHERDFNLAYPHMDAIFEDILHERGEIFKQAIQSFNSLHAEIIYTSLFINVEIKLISQRSKCQALLSKP